MGLKSLAAHVGLCFGKTHTTRVRYVGLFCGSLSTYAGLFLHAAANVGLCLGKTQTKHVRYVGLFCGSLFTYAGLF